MKFYGELSAQHMCINTQEAPHIAERQIDG